MRKTGKNRTIVGRKKENPVRVFILFTNMSIEKMEKYVMMSVVVGFVQVKE